MGVVLIIVDGCGREREVSALCGALQAAKITALAVDSGRGKIEGRDQVDDGNKGFFSSAYMISRIYPLGSTDSTQKPQRQDCSDAPAPDGSVGWHALCIHKESGQELHLVASLLIIMGNKEPSHSVSNSHKRKSTARNDLSWDNADCVYDDFHMLQRHVSNEISQHCTDIESPLLSHLIEASLEETPSPSSPPSLLMPLDERKHCPAFLGNLIQTCDGRPLLKQPLALVKGIVPEGLCNILVPQVSEPVRNQDTAMPLVEACVRAAWITLFALGQINTYPVSLFEDVLDLGLMIQDIDRASHCSSSYNPDLAKQSWVSELMQQLGASEDCISSVYNSLKIYNSCLSTSLSSPLPSISMPEVVAAAVSGLLGQSSPRGRTRSGLQRSRISYGNLVGIFKKNWDSELLSEDIMKRAPSTVARIKFALLSLDQGSRCSSGSGPSSGSRPSSDCLSRGSSMMTGFSLPVTPKNDSSRSSQEIAQQLSLPAVINEESDEIGSL